MLVVSELKEKLLRTSLEIFEKLRTNATEIFQEGKAAAVSKKEKLKEHKQEPETNFSIERNDQHLKDYH
jgi:hypothetical protein